MGEIGKKFYKEILDEKRALYYDTNVDNDINVLIQKTNENFEETSVKSLNYYDLVKSLTNEKLFAK